MQREQVEMTCPVCCEKFTVQKRKSIDCPSCGEAACSACVKQYIVSGSRDADCMHCHHPYDREFLSRVLPCNFLSTAYKSHREQVLLDRELCLLPATQPIVANYRLARTLRDAVNTTTKTIAELKAALDTATRVKRESSWRLHRIMRSEYMSDGLRGGAEENDDKAVKVVCGCPTALCRGFIVASTGKCGVCEAVVCLRCLELKGEGHTCQETAVATATMLKRDTKPCPKCASMIHKIDGCNQIWCTQCHTAFDWHTGFIESGRIHNPHYYQWLRAQSTTGQIPRVPGDMEGGCPVIEEGRLPTAWHLHERLPRNNPSYDNLMTWHRTAQHVQESEIRYLRRMLQRPVERENVDLRIRFLVGEISSEHWKSALVRREKQKARHVETLQIYELFLAVAIDAFRALVVMEYTPSQCCEGLRAVSRHVNTAFRELAKRYQVVTPTIFDGGEST